MSHCFFRRPQIIRRPDGAAFSDSFSHGGRSTETKMQRLGLLVCFIIGVTQSAVQVDPRGARPVEHGTRSEKCASEKEWPFCTTDEWGPKCPSGCRIEGLMNKYDHSLLKRIEKIRSLLDENTVKQRSTDSATKQTYDYLKDKLTTDAGHNNNYYDLAQNLRQRITDMKIKIDRQLRILAALKDRVKDQVVEMQRLEVDVDIKLRSCKGSCQGYAEFQVDHEDYVVLDKQINQLDSQSAQRIDSVKTLYVMKSRPLKESNVDSIYKSSDTTGAVAAQRREDVFTDVPMVQLLLGEEGSSSSPATISKDQVCVRLKQQNQDGRQPRRKKYKRQQCRARKDVPLCSDDDWVSKCPSGCRLQGLISQVESDVERKLRTVCETGKTYEDMAEKSMKAMTHIYNYNRRVIVNIYTSELKFVEQAERLAGNLTSLRKRSFRLSRELDELRRNAQIQLEDLYRTEVRLQEVHFKVNFLLHLILFNSVSHRRKLIFSCVIFFLPQ
uniref:Fibrinogen alpha chain n=1 Tax=Sparus aurata TaxID=8175 RepID=A0A671UFC9_SPAAU